jgi:DNA-binding response OmpR family regulator
MRALVVDDEELLQALMRESLERAGWAVVTTGDPGDALHLAGAQPFDLALVDLHLDGGAMSGAALCRRLAGAGLPVVVVTGALDLDAAQVSCAYEVLAKPFGPRELVAAAARAVGRPP